MGKLQTFITAYQSKIEEFEQDYINNDLPAIKQPLQEFFGHTSNIVSILRDYDKVDIDINEITARITADSYANTFDKDRDEVEKLYLQAQKYLLNKTAERLKQEYANIISTINIAKGV